MSATTLKTEIEMACADAVSLDIVSGDGAETSDGGYSAGRVGLEDDLVGGAPGPLLRDWSAALGLVERAAVTIHAYEAKFVAVESETQTFIHRVKEEQQRYVRRIVTLEQTLTETQRRAEAVETALTTALKTIAELRTDSENQRRILSEAEADLKRSRSNLRKVSDLLDGL